ncbi:MFS transporter [Tropicimonas isoalkanivorans]|uniref:H+ Antiporter protein n=1 Tax=Tropicimonas isoalkanivorans TaxID=441112 RepID=A0A1I1JID9_9RHOB|nr:MFS transporter [Tropicimonas isoalkanivorans]SFC48105.1 H+ Antiporter protein [Tropicimonas isoalkanivorans]
MISILSNRTYRHLFAAQVVALLGTGLATVALGLLAFDLAGSDAAMVLGTALTIKMVAYVTISPVAGALASRWPRRRMLVALDVLRAAVALLLPFVTEVWHIYALVFVLQSASAAFTPTFQATIPDVLPEESEYTRALSLSRLAYDLESLVSPMLAALLLAVVSSSTLFLGTCLGFIGSALLVVSVLLPSPAPSKPRGFYDATLRGLVIYLRTPRLRGLLALSFSAAAAGAMVIVNTVVLVRGGLGQGDRSVALTLAAFGAGSMLAALALPRVLDRLPDRRVMVAGAGVMAAVLLTLALVIAASGLHWPGLLTAWLFLGLGYSAVLTPSGRLLRRSAHPEDRPAVFAAQFALSHACWLLAYPLSAWVQTRFGAVPALTVLGLLTVAGLATALRIWRADMPRELEHRHDDLSPDHPHLSGAGHHRHVYVIDDLHRHWPHMG